jgi:four helix bundle protein
MTKSELQKRTKTFALRIIKLVNALPRTPAAKAIGGQLIRSGTSVGSNYRASCRARSRADFVSKIGIVEEEADESAFWIEMLIEAEILPAKRLADLLNEANEITAIATQSGRTARTNGRRKAQSSTRESEPTVP